MSYIPLTDAEKKEMLEAIGISSVADLFVDVPQEHRYPSLGLAPPQPELFERTIAKRSSWAPAHRAALPRREWPRTATWL